MSANDQIIEWEYVSRTYWIGLTHDGGTSEALEAAAEALPGWAKEEYLGLLREHPIGEDMPTYRDWFRALVSQNPIPERCDALLVGLFEASESDQVHPAMYVCAYEGFDADDDEAFGYEAWDWAPDGKNAGQTQLSAFFHADSDRRFYEFVCGIVYGRIAVAIASDESPIPGLDRDAPIHVLTGWDGGDLFYLGDRSEGRFTPRSPELD